MSTIASADLPPPGSATGVGAPAAGQDPAPALELQRASVRIDGRPILSDVSVSVAGGEFVALLGANGSGKSTLLRAVLGMLELSAGSISVLGRPPGAANAQIGYLPQRQTFDAGMRLRGVDIVRLGLDGTRWGVPLPAPRWSAAGARRRADAERIEQVIELVGASAYAKRPIGELSGGEQQRLLIAQALVENLTLVSNERLFDATGVSRLW